MELKIGEYVIKTRKPHYLQEHFDDIMITLKMLDLDFKFSKGVGLYWQPIKLRTKVANNRLVICFNVNSNFDLMQVGFYDLDSGLKIDTEKNFIEPLLAFKERLIELIGGKRP